MGVATPQLWHRLYPAWSQVSGLALFSGWTLPDTRSTLAASRFPASYLDTTEPLWDWPEEEEEVVALS